MNRTNSRPQMLVPRIGAILVVCLALPTPAHAAEPVVTATTRQRVHPVLIRNDHNALMQVVITADQPGTSVGSFVFNLNGTDKRRDISTLQLFSSGRGTTFTTGTSFGRTLKPAARVIFRGAMVLQRGTNVFWLSCTLNKTADLSNKVDAVCSAIGTSAGSVVPKDATPKVRKRIGIALRKHNDEGVHTHRIAALATTPEGTLLCVYDMRRRKSRDLQEDIDIGLLRSTDGGKSWEKQRVIMDMGTYGRLPEEQNGCSDPGIIVDRNTGEIFVAAVWMWGKPGKHQWSGDGSEPGYKIGKSAQYLMVRSRDDGKTWSKPANMTRQFKKREWWLFAPSPQQGITLKDGTLVWPSQGRDKNGTPFSNIIVSRDHGKTWTVSNPASIGNSECQAVELTDGSVMLNMRTESPTKFRTVFTTRDLGKTWKAHPTNRKTLIEPNCNGSLYRFDYRENGKAKHVLLFANPYSRKGRTHHSIRVSFDDGRSWPAKYRMLLDEGRGRGYPSLSRIDEKHIGIVYEGSRSDLAFEKIALSELLKR